MRNKRSRIVRRGLCAAAALLAVIVLQPAWSAPNGFGAAKVEMRESVYHDQNQSGVLGTLYCGCDWSWVGRSGGRVDHASCGYEPRAQENRADRTEWEHIVPASHFGRARQCWQDGGRKNCKRTDPVFSAMEADMHNLTLTIGEVNADRSNFQFGVIPGEAREHGACDLEVDFKGRVFEPREEVRGLVARVAFYIHDRYDVRMAESQQRLFLAWDRQYPVSEWERERDRRIAARMGHHNRFVTGERVWTLGHKNSGEGVVSKIPIRHPAREVANEPDGGVIRGNGNSNIYHLPTGCPSYNRMADHNIVPFDSEAAAQAAGYRKAGNCR